MKTDKDLDAAQPESIVDIEDLSAEDKMGWLLDEDMSEPEETLFKVDEDEYQDQGLSAFEAEVAARPMFRGNDGGDDLSNYVAEEIVISSESERSDIYADADAADESAQSSDAQIMAIDHSRREERNVAAEASVSEGSDILGLAGDDDMGETYLTIKRVKSGVAETGAVASVVNGGAVSTGPASSGADEAPDLEAMPEAPVTSQVADPSTQEVANEQAEVAEEDTVQTPVADSPEIAPEMTVDNPAASDEAPVFEVAAEGELADFAEDLGDDMFMDLQIEGEDQDDNVLGDLSLESADTTDDCDAQEDGFDLEFSLEEGVTVDEAAQDAEPEPVQDEEPVAGETTVDAAAETEPEADSDFDSVLDYVASTPQPSDDEAFDDFLLQGAGLEEVEADLEQLDVEPAEGELVLEAGEDRDIEFHEDFGSLDGVSREAAGQLSAVLPALMQEVADAAAVRLSALGMDANALGVDAMLGTDDASVQRCADEGYAPVCSVFTEVPAALQSLGEQERAVIYVRLVDGANDRVINDLFSDAFDSGVEGAGEDIFGDDFDDLFGDLAAESGDTLGGDIDDAFTALSDDDATDVFDADALAEAQAAAVDVEPAQPEAEIELETTVESIVEADSDDETLEPLDTLPEAASVDMDDVEVEEEELEPIDTSDTSWCIPSDIKFSYTSASTAEIFADFLDAFIEEGSAEIEKLEDLVSVWEKDIESEQVNADVARTLHTIKGIAKGVGLQRFGTLIHNFETLLEGLERPANGQVQGYFRIVNVWLDAVVRGIEFVTEERADIASELPQVGGAAPMDVVEESPVEAAEADEAQLAEAEQSPEAEAEREKQREQQLADEGAKALAAQQSVRITSDKLDHMLNLASQSQQLCVRASQNTTRTKRSTAELQGRLSSVRTHIGKIADRALLTVNARGNGASAELDALEMDQYSELQEAASILREGVEDLADLIEVLSRQNTQVEALLNQQSSVISSISSSLQGARVVPVSRLMPGLRRIVRTVSTDLGKVVAFRVLNEIGALDRDRYARLQVALEHMVRNALDHGIESPEERLAAGKPNAGRITIDVTKSGGDYVIKLSDDGRGIDPDALRESAYNKGLDLDVDALSDDEAVRLIFHKGFSTASQVSEISGRGVGMDIVLTELQQIGGDIQVRSAVGLGTTFEVRIPSNVTVNGALLVTAADYSYAIPLNGLIAVEQVPVDDFYKAVSSGGTLDIFDMPCEPAYLATLCQGAPLPERNFWEQFVPVIIAGSEDRYMAIAIDNLQEALELVVRSLGSQFSAVPGLAGAATTADGEALVALDLNLLVDSAREDGVTDMAVTQEEGASMLALVVDDSRTQRMVATSQLDTVGVETVTAENGQVAIDLLNATQRLPDVVLLDVEMPVKDGIQTLREIRKSQRYGHLPVIMVTSRTGAKHRALAREAGCNAYMGKPFNFPALIEQINVLTGHDLQLS